MKNESRQLELFGHLCDGTITPELQEELEALLISDADARQSYIEYVDVHLAMVEKGKMLSASSTEKSHRIPGIASGVEYLSGETNQSSPSRIFPAISVATYAWFSLFGLLLAAGIGLGAATLFWPTSVTKSVAVTETVANQPLDAGHLSSKTGMNAAASDPLFVAQVVRVTPDVVWGDHSAKPDFLLRARRGDRVSIVSGFVELEYYCGAKLILHGPCSYVLTGKKSGRLEKGQITGDVEGGDFFIMTPTARVIDLGTEFGVAVSESDLTDVCVFDGEVRVVSDYSGVKAGQDAVALSLTQGMTARIQRDGKIDQDPFVDVKQFTRKFPGTISSKVNQLSLVDVFSAASKGRFRLAGVIAPDTGKADQSPWLRDTGPGHRSSDRYLPTDWHPYVDGVFIPDLSGVETQVDSFGNRVNLPESMGRTWGPVWSRRKFDGDEALPSYEDYWGTSTLEVVVERLNRCQTGMIGMHSSVGVTFDLAAVRDLGGVPQEVQLTVSNLDNSAVHRPSWSARNRFSADFYVFVDGKPKASRIDFQNVDGEMEIKVPLSIEDRFLTFVTSDAMGRDGFDHVVIIDPVLLME